MVAILSISHNYAKEEGKYVRMIEGIFSTIFSSLQILLSLPFSAGSKFRICVLSSDFVLDILLACRCLSVLRAVDLILMMISEEVLVLGYLQFHFAARAAHIHTDGRKF